MNNSKDFVLIVGSGAREHALARAIKKSPSKPHLAVWASNRNPGLIELASAFQTGNLEDGKAISRFAKETGVCLAIIGPENPLAAGVADELRAAGISVFGPGKESAKIESSKKFTRKLLTQAKLPGCPDFRAGLTSSQLPEFYDKWKGQIVLKADVLMGGKGVFVAGDHFNSLKEALHITKGWEARGVPFIVEEKMVGEEFSLMTISDGEQCLHLPLIQDHKRAYEGDEGPNTGGMGSYSCSGGSLPFVDPKDVQAARDLNEATVALLREKTGEPYRGVLYGGYMAVRDGVRLVEFNARFGDPEILNVIPLLSGDFFNFCLGVANGNMDKSLISISEEASVCKYLVPEGYPLHPKSDLLVELPKKTEKGELFLGSVDERPEGLVCLRSRTLAYTVISSEISKAEKQVNDYLKQIPGKFFFREDIGKETTLQKRVTHMNHIRS